MNAGQSVKSQGTWARVGTAVVEALSPWLAHGCSIVLRLRLVDVAELLVAAVGGETTGFPPAWGTPRMRVFRPSAPRITVFECGPLLTWRRTGPTRLARQRPGPALSPRGTEERRLL